MTQANLSADVHFQGNAAQPWFDLAEMNRVMGQRSAEQRVAWVLEQAGPGQQG